MHDFLKENDIETRVLKMPMRDEEFEEGSDAMDAIEAIEKGLIDLVINIPRSLERNDLTSGYLVRRKTVDYGIGLLTNIQAANLFVDALWKIRDTDELMVKPWGEYC